MRIITEFSGTSFQQQSEWIHYSTVLINTKDLNEGSRESVAHADVCLFEDGCLLACSAI
jgi:hypothetical protein